MIICTGDEITLTDQYRHKFDSAMAEYLYHLSLISGEDRSSGTVECSTGWFAQFGKRLLIEDSQGSVWLEYFHTVDEATAAYDLLATEYDMWDSDPEED
jgi:hypothetical protein